MTGFEHRLTIPQWGVAVRVMIYRKHVRHASRKNFQLDLFTPDDGHFEYYAVATNMTLALPALFAFVCGRGAQEKTIAELKGEFALDVVPTNRYAANSAWQQLSVLAHNLIRSFQLDTGAKPKRRSRKRTYAFLFRGVAYAALPRDRPRWAHRADRRPHAAAAGPESPRAAALRQAPPCLGRLSYFRLGLTWTWVTMQVR